jgi:2-dehydropantoate 2-reductase
MNILFVGRGVIASVYGWALAEAGHRVVHLVRPGRSAELGRPLEIDLIDRRAGGPKDGKVPALHSYQPTCVEDLACLGDFDLAVLSVRHDQARAAAAQLAAAPQPRLGVLLFNNCWEDPAAIAAVFPAGKAAWGFPVAGGGFNAEGSLVASLLPNVHLEAGVTQNAALVAEVARLLEAAGFTLERHADMRAWLWRHFAVNTGLVAAAVKAGTDAAGLLADRRSIVAGIRMAREAVLVAEARGVGKRAEAGESLIARLPAGIGARMLQSVARDPAIRRIMTTHANPAEQRASSVTCCRRPGGRASIARAWRPWMDRPGTWPDFDGKTGRCPLAPAAPRDLGDVRQSPGEAEARLSRDPAGSRCSPRRGIAPAYIYYLIRATASAGTNQFSPPTMPESTTRPESLVSLPFTLAMFLFWKNSTVSLPLVTIILLPVGSL